MGVPENGNAGKWEFWKSGLGQMGIRENGHHKDTFYRKFRS